MEGQGRCSDSANPPCPQGKDDQIGVQNCPHCSGYSAGNRQQNTFTKKDSSNCGGSKPDGAQQAHLANPLFNAQLEEQDSKKKRRDDQKETEVDEVLAKIRCALRRVETLLADGVKREIL